MIEESLLNYGVLGLWTATLVYEKITFQKQMKEIILKNTEVLNRVVRGLKKND